MTRDETNFTKEYVVPRPLPKPGARRMLENTVPLIRSSPRKPRQFFAVASSMGRIADEYPAERA